MYRNYKQSTRGVIVWCDKRGEKKTRISNIFRFQMLYQAYSV